MQNDARYHSREEQGRRLATLGLLLIIFPFVGAIGAAVYLTLVEWLQGTNMTGAGGVGILFGVSAIVLVPAGLVMYLVGLGMQKAAQRFAKSQAGTNQPTSSIGEAVTRFVFLTVVILILLPGIVNTIVWGNMEWRLVSLVLLVLPAVAWFSNLLNILRALRARWSNKAQATPSSSTQTQLVTPTLRAAQQGSAVLNSSSSPPPPPDIPPSLKESWQAASILLVACGTLAGITLAVGSLLCPTDSSCIGEDSVLLQWILSMGGLAILFLPGVILLWVLTAVPYFIAKARAQKRHSPPHGTLPFLSHAAPPPPAPLSSPPAPPTPSTPSPTPPPSPTPTPPPPHPNQSEQFPHLFR